MTPANVDALEALDAKLRTLETVIVAARTASPVYTPLEASRAIPTGKLPS